MVDGWQVFGVIRATIGQSLTTLVKDFTPFEKLKDALWHIEQIHGEEYAQFKDKESEFRHILYDLLQPLVFERVGLLIPRPPSRRRTQSTWTQSAGFSTLLLRREVTTPWRTLSTMSFCHYSGMTTCGMWIHPCQGQEVDATAWISSCPHAAIETCKFR